MRRSAELQLSNEPATDLFTDSFSVRQICGDCKSAARNINYFTKQKEISQIFETISFNNNLVRNDICIEKQIIFINMTLYASR